MGELAQEFISGGTPSTKEPTFWGGSIPWTTSAPISEHDTRLDQGQRFITHEGLQTSATHLVPKGSLLIGTRVGVGKAVVNLVDIAISQDLTGVVLDSAQVDNEFSAYQFKMGRIQQFFGGRKRGTTIKGISRFDLQLLELYVPSLPEQRAIAHALRTVQEAQATRRREVALERERKAALMQHLFTHGTRGEPRKQTEIGEMPESWQLIELAQIVDIVYGAQAAVAHSLDESIGTPILTNINITKEGILDLSTLRYYKIPDSKYERLILQKGDLLFNWRSGSQAHVGKTALFDLDGEYTFSSFILRFRVTGPVNNLFLLYYLHRIRAQGFFAQNRQQSSVNSVFNASVAATIPIVLPPLSEQHGIADALRACDAKIAAVEREAAILDELFRAMLEELMTGRLSARGLLE